MSNKSAVDKYPRHTTAGFEGLSFDEQFGEIRSILNEQDAWEQRGDELWYDLFHAATQHQQRFLDAVAPYVRSSAFFAREHKPPMYQSWSAFDGAYEEFMGYDATWADYNEYDTLGYMLCYGMPLGQEIAALLGVVNKPHGYEHDPVVWCVGDQIGGGYKGQVFYGLNAGALLIKDLSLGARLKALDDAFNRLLGEPLKLLGVKSEPSLYMYLYGYKVEASLIFGPYTEIEGSEGRWSSDIKGEGLDVVRKHERYDQDYQLNNVAYRCAKVDQYFGQSIHEIKLTTAKESKAAKRLNKAGHKDYERSYRIFTHM